MYSDKVIQHFKQPHNQGSIKNADAVGQKGNPVCGDVMKIYLKIKDNKIKDIKFETLGCAAAIAVSSALTDLVKNKTLDQALNITKDSVVSDLDGLPVSKIHCSMLGVDALHHAIKEYKKKRVLIIKTRMRIALKSTKCKLKLLTISTQGPYNINNIIYNKKIIDTSYKHYI